VTSLTVGHLLWRMGNVHTESEVVFLPSGGRPQDRRTLSFPEVARRVLTLAVALRDALGIGSGDTVAVLAFNTLEHWETMLAVPTLGAAVNSLNVRLDVATLGNQAIRPAPAAALVDIEVLTHPVVGENARLMLKTLLDAQVPLIAVGDVTHWTTEADTIVAFEDLVTARHGSDYRQSAAAPDEQATAYWFNTSGTTGQPKTYPVSHRAAMLHTLAQSTVNASGLSDADRVLALAPFFHVNGWGLPLICAMTGASLVLVGGDLDRHRVATVLSAEKVTVAAAVPTVWHDVCSAVASGQAPIPLDLREVVSGGSAVPESLVQAISTVLGASVATAWGMTETMAMSTYERMSPGSRAGKPLPLIETRIRDARQYQDGANEVGILEVRGDFVIGAEGDEWLDTGDIVSIDQAGRLALHDRQKDLIKSGGEWIATAELEQHLCAHPSVVSAAVVAAADARWMERPVAFIVAKRPRSASDDIEADLRRHIGGRFPRWWIPDQFHFVPCLPSTSVGKVDKRQLRHQLDLKTESEALT
jgi:fatty-acyl-CoA synthase